MNIKYFLSYLIFILFTSAIFLSCSSTSLTVKWKDSEYGSGKFNKIVVIAIFKKLENRKYYEDAAVKALKANGTDAVGGLTFIAPDQYYKYEDMKKVFAEQNIDGIMIIRLKDFSKKEKYYPAREEFIPDDTNSMDTGYFQGFYMGYQHLYEQPSYIEDTYIFNIDSNLYAANDNRLVWTSEAKTRETGISGDEPANSADDSADLAKVIVNELVKEKLIR